MSFFEADVPGERYPMGRLNRINLPEINHLIKGQLKALRLPLVFAGVNISLIEDRLSKTAPFWQARVSGVVVAFSARRARKALKELYPADRWEQYPEGYSGCTLPEALSKIVRPECVRELESLYPWMGAATHRGFATMTKYVALRPPQMREFARWLGHYQMSVRYALIGCRLNKDRMELTQGVKERLEELVAGSGHRQS